MNVYSIDVKIVATAYIRAETEEEARQLFLDNFREGYGGELPTDDYADIAVSGRQYDDPKLPDVSLSPAISFFGPAGGDGDIDLDLVEENVPDAEDA